LSRDAARRDVWVLAMTDEELRDLVLRALDGLPVTSRSMFGGYGLYLGGAFFAVISEGTLYFRTDDESRADYVSRGMTALQPRYRPRGPKTVDRNFRVPPDVLADEGRLREWALRAASVAQQRPRSRPSRRGDA
jgi:DNA transformation protein